MQDSKDFINFGAVSRHLSGTRSALTRSNIPKKHEKKVQELINFIEKWKQDDTN